MTSDRRSLRQLSSSKLAGSVFVMAGRASVYLSGFAYNLLFSYLLSRDAFGAFAALMAISELLLIPATLGSALVVYRRSRETHKVPVGEIGAIIVIGGGLASAAALLLSQSGRFPEQQLLLALYIALPLGAAQLFVSCYRGLGYISLFTFDPTIRYSLYVLSATILFIAGSYGFAWLVAAVVASNIAIFAAYLGVGLTLNQRSWSIALRVSEQLWLFLSSLLSFAVRKSDILILSAGLSNSELGNLKIAFLLAEAPVQFVQAVLYKYASVFEFSKPQHNDTKRRVSTALAAMGIILSAGALTFAFAFQWYFEGKYDFMRAMPWLLVYYMEKMISLPLDQALIMEGKGRLLTSINASSAIIKIATLSIGTPLLGVSIVILYPLMGLLDIVVLELLARRYLKVSFLSWLLR